MFEDKYDVIVIGGGHAGCEAALAAARMGVKTLMLNLSIDNTALMPCNPSIGGPAKGHLVHECSALGGEQANAADHSTLMLRWLNTSKGPAVRALRAQCDPALYSLHYRKTLTSQENLNINQDEAIKLLVNNNNEVTGVETRHNAVYHAKAVVLCGGVYLNSRVFMGDLSFPSGPMGQPNSNLFLNSLVEHGIKTGRMRTDTTPRLNLNTIDFNKMTPQRSEPEALCFDIFGEPKIYNNQNYACYFSHSNIKTHEILKNNIHRSPLVTGAVEVNGPRYCPSFEDKFIKFPDRTSHPIIFEPVSLNTNEVYVQNFSTSLPYDVQVELVHSLEGCENAKIIRPGYGIEYAYLIPSQLKSSLESKVISGLFTAGQVNGTSGYEEAGSQGLLAGINAALFIKELEPVILNRAQAYLGVLIDDLATKSTEEPYRMLTSRCEHRLLLRWDNAARRLAHIGRRIGLINDLKWRSLEEKFSREDNFINYLNNFKLTPSEANNNLCEEFDADLIREPVSAAEFMRHKGASLNLINKLIDNNNFNLNAEESFYVETELKYAGYIEKEERTAAKMSGLDNALIPEDFNYENIKSLSAESRQKLIKFKPRSLGQALRISGVTPTDIQLLSVLIKAKN